MEASKALKGSLREGSFSATLQPRKVGMPQKLPTLKSATWSKLWMELRYRLLPVDAPPYLESTIKSKVLFDFWEGVASSEAFPLDQA